MTKILLSLLLISPAFAYLDPGTGSMLVYFVMGVFATIIYYFKSFFYKLQALIKGGKIDKSLLSLDGIDILFFSEGAQYTNVFLPIIKELEKRGVKSAYYTMGANDPLLDMEFEHLKKLYIGSSLGAFAIMNRVETKLVVMTTPQLDVMQLRRSKNVEKYIHIVHAPADVLLYKKFAFDYFDVIMCSGDHQKRGLRALEAARDLPPKLLLETGLTYYDVMAQKIPDQPDDGQTILVAPTWGASSMLNKYGLEPLRSLVATGKNIILRPHPQSFISEKDLMTEIENAFATNQNFTIDKNPTGEISMQKASVMISDISGIIFDFFFIYEKPLVLLEGAYTKDGYEAEDVEFDPWEIGIFGEIASVISDEQISNIAEITLKAIESHSLHKTKELRDASVYNFANAGKVAADQLIALLEQN